MVGLVFLVASEAPSREVQALAILADSFVCRTCLTFMLRATALRAADVVLVREDDIFVPNAATFRANHHFRFVLKTFFIEPLVTKYFLWKDRSIKGDEHYALPFQGSFREHSLSGTDDKHQQFSRVGFFSGANDFTHIVMTNGSVCLHLHRLF